MTMYLLIINFIVDGIILIGMFLLFMKDPSREEMQKQKQIAREIEGTFQSYLEEIREENRKFEQNTVSRRSDSLTEKKEEVSGNRRTKSEDPIEFQPPVTESREKVEFSEELKVKKMAEEGKSLEEMAKLLGTGKTEVEMMMKLIRRQQ
ncbi:hypothetical protein AAV35_006965 [Salimicrobium jeotgali]|uniref:Coupling factor for flagellin transcription and translation n=2 Tax=Salimicrobium jeotgali TaxID=1230341 RepID=K2HB32_9BACI|nr:hypothetical protein [Salimicrobium jeotgali]AKG04556.1 hypothetical protein AAV35_006965 [Salimicrobium jeotgali]EKE32770.1 hypothetical protein MJ3_02392 [Salimicrobium jeotgali]MBM7695242.1 Skp family chaperone for outer membrane proteins [Salimicrobium jeotgali]